LISATALLLSFSPLKPLQASDLTTAVSARVAPYMKRPSGYIRPEFLSTVIRDRHTILAIAKRYNQHTVTEMSDEQFATVMVAILYNEHNGWLEDVVPGIRPLTPVYQHAQALSNAWFGTNYSVWPTNLRPSVVREILMHTVPQVGHVTLPLELPAHTDTPQRAQTLANTPDNAYELLGANLRRGMYRAQHEEVVITWQTLLSWHNAGVVHPSAIARNASLQHYLTRAVPYVTHAQALFDSVGMCQNSTDPANTTGHAHTERPVHQ
jgi:hypothetical protein